MSSSRFRCVVGLLYFSILPSEPSLFGETNFKKGGWEDVSQEELQISAPKIDPNADCEFLYRELRVVDTDSERTNFYYYNRAKIFTEAGVQEWAKVDVVYQTGWYVRDLKARVIYPDGTVKDLQRKDIYKRDIFKDDRFEGKSKSFSFPGLKPGCIVEYRWQQVRKYWVPGLEVPLRAEWPTWKFDLTIKPWRRLASSMRFYNTIAEWDNKRDGFFISVTHQPAISDKPQLAARKDFEPFVALVYAGDIKQFDAEKYWGYRGGALVEINKDFVKVRNREIKKLAEQLFQGRDLNEDKLKAAYDYCANEIVNISEYTDTYTEEEIEDLDDNDSPSDTIKRGYGTRYDINAVFASLCAAGGFQAYLAQVEDHREFSYKSFAIGGFNLSDWVVAIREGMTWRYFDPGSSFLPFEILNPNNVDSNLIVADKKYYYMEKTPNISAEFSQTNRIANASVNEYGDLEAEIAIQYRGYAGLWRKRMFAAMTDQEKEDYILQNEWKSRLPRTEIENLEIKHATSRSEDLVVTYSIKVAAFADALGDRMIFNPSLFEQGASHPFPDADRTEPIAWDYLPMVIDKITFAMPEGYKVEDPFTADGSLNTDLIDRRSKSEIDPLTGAFTFNRLYSLKLRKVYGHNYAAVKANFDYVVEADSRVVSFSRGTDEES